MAAQTDPAIPAGRAKGQGVSALAPLLQAFFTERLARQRDASPHTIASYRDSFRLLLEFLNQQTGKAPTKLQLEDLDPATITAFLGYLENERGNSVRTRNARLTAIHSFFHYAALKAPESADQIARVLSIPEKRYESTLISYLTEPEIDALLAAPDRSAWTGRRDHALLLMAVQTGLRVSELAGLRRQDLNLGAGAWVRCRGKGRKERCTPLTRATVQVLRVWLRELSADPATPLFPSRGGGHLTRSAIWRLVAKHTNTARGRCPSLTAKNITPHVLRHSAAMRLLRAPTPVDTATIALWLGHESLDSTNKYLHADMEIKRRALDRTTPPNTKPGRYRAPDRLLAFLESL
jgi:integrase/recombinase XerD